MDSPIAGSHETKITIQESLEEHDKETDALIWPPKSLDAIQFSIPRVS